jgi:mono/diheme cytochrome c family protein
MNENDKPKVVTMQPCPTSECDRRAPLMLRGVVTSLGVIIVASFLLGAARAAPPISEVRFEADILPLLKAKCVRCHGGNAPKGDLDLTSSTGVLKGGESGPIVVSGKADKSLLYEKVHDGTMPPRKKDRLSESELVLIRRWIETGATTAKPAAPALTQHDVIPILLRRCTVCHGARQQEGGLDMRTRVSLLRGGKSGPAIVPGKPEASLLIQKIRTGAMPPLRRIIEVSIKPIEPAETEILARWIALGAPEVAIEPDVAGTTPDPLVTDKDRAFWSFQPPRRPPAPLLANPASVRNPIDAFILQKLEAKGLTLSPEADRMTLLRRVCQDLIGLPPDPADVEAFGADGSSNAYEKLVDRLLASPRYGERWGRHWLDVAGYADSEGKREQDQPRPNAYRYRDYVIRAFNADKPYDRFLLEQLAGDELADYVHVPEITQELADNLVATGFLRMAPDPTWYNLTNFVPDRLEVMADEIDVLGSSVMGLTLKCARCHSHKFDPLPQRDYYRLVAVFKGAFDEHDWMKSNWHTALSMGRRTDRDLPYIAADERRAWEKYNADIQKAITALRRNYLLQLAPGFRRQVEETTKQIQALEAKKLPEPKLRALWDRGDPSPTYIYRRGDYLTPGRLVGPGVPSVLTDGKTPFEVRPPWRGANKTGRRLAFARWLTRPDHPLTARVMVNRIWRHHFGAGLVKTLDNFGKMGARPSHPELLDWLAREFVEQGWSIKAMHRLMVTSACYRQGSHVTPTLEKLDPDNALCSRMPLLRLGAEQLYDTMLRVAGCLDESVYGPPDAVEVRPDGLVTPAATARGWRRGVYVQQQRKVVASHLENFDFPQMNPNCVDRRDSTVAPQALYLMNNGMVQYLAEHFARRVAREAGSDPERQIERVYVIALGRPADAAEKQLGQDVLAGLRNQWADHLAHTGKPDAVEAAQRALLTYCHAIVNSAEFLYID